MDDSSPPKPGLKPEPKMLQFSLVPTEREIDENPTPLTEYVRPSNPDQYDDQDRPELNWRERQHDTYGLAPGPDALPPVQRGDPKPNSERSGESYMPPGMTNKETRPQKAQRRAAAKKGMENKNRALVIHTSPPTILSKRRAKLEDGLSKQDWLNVYDAFQYSGVPQELEERTGIPHDSISHMLDVGIVRLGLPPIREHAIDYARVNRKLQAAGLPAPTDLDVRELPADARDAINERVVQEGAAARQALSSAVKANEIFSGYLEQVALLTKAGKWDLPDGVSAALLEKVAKVLVANTLAVERAVKLMRLTQGEPTEAVSLHISHLLAHCTTAELLEAERTGAIPSRLKLQSIVDISPGESFNRLVDAPRQILSSPRAQAADFLSSSPPPSDLIHENTPSVGAAASMSLTALDKLHKGELLAAREARDFEQAALHELGMDIDPDEPEQ